MEKESNNKIETVTASAMVTMAIIFDFISSIPIINIVSDIIAWLIFTTWFYFLGAGLLNPKKFATISVSFLAELIPFVSMLPLTTVGVCILIFMQNHPALGMLAHKGLNTKKQTLNKKIKDFKQTSKKPPIQDVKKKESAKETSNPENKKSEVRPDITPQPSTTVDKKPENQEVKKTTPPQEDPGKKDVQPGSREEKTETTETPDKKESVSKENNSEDQKADYEKNKQDLKNIEYLQGKIPQRRFIRDIDPPAPYGEEDQDRLDMAA